MRAKKEQHARKRVRKQKERFAETEVQKLANKRAFSEASGEYGDDAMGLDFGMLGKAGSGQLRVTKARKTFLMSR